jgi:alpha-beta hydrolase superfamily lysophospholipase
VPDLTASFPTYLAERARITTFAGVPSLIAHPDWSTPAPLLLWLHGRTAYKELDPGRYLRLIRAGIAVLAIDLPGHGARGDAAMQAFKHSLDVLEQASREITPVLESLRTSEHGQFIDFSRTAIGGMSLGGMTTLHRLCSPHSFSCAVIEGATGWLAGQYFPARHDLSPAKIELFAHEPARVAQLDPMDHLDTFRPIPILIMHSEADEMVPWPGMRRFLDELASRYRRAAADPASIRVQTWATTGAPQEHLGFGRVASEAKTILTDFVAEQLSAKPPALS